MCGGKGGGLVRDIKIKKGNSGEGWRAIHPFGAERGADSQTRLKRESNLHRQEQTCTGSKALKKPYISLSTETKPTDYKNRLKNINEKQK